MSSSANFNEKDVGFIGEDLILEGTVHSRNKLVIHGTIKGEISGDFSLDRSMYDKFVTGMYRSFQDQIFSNKTDVFFVKIR